MTETTLKTCPFCGAKISVVICDDEGNIHDEEYEKAPWSGLGYRLYHDIADDPTGSCPIAGYEGEGLLGIWLYDTRNEAIDAWNRRKNEDTVCGAWQSCWNDLKNRSVDND